MYDVIVVGSGFAGSVFARKFAEESDKTVLVVEQRNHIAGNMYDEIDEKSGILVQKYGPHFFCTQQWEIIEWLSRFTEWKEWCPRALSFLDGKYIWRPYNFKTLQQLMGYEKSARILAKIRREFPNRKSISVFEFVNHSDADIAEYGYVVYNKLYVPYVAKQWGLKPDEIDPEIINRAQLFTGYDWQIGVDIDFQFIPQKGYTEMFKQILDHPNITVKLNCDANQHIEFDDATKTVLYNGENVPLLIYTGALDELFCGKYGELPYRSRYFEYKRYEREHFLPIEVVTYPQDEKYIRQTDYSYFNRIGTEKKYTVVAEEYSLPYIKAAEKGNEPFYPINNLTNDELYKKYKLEADKYSNLVICGRLASFKYLDMHTVIQDVFRKYKDITQR
mgnify:CR=1 FL=1